MISEGGCKLENAAQKRACVADWFRTAEEWGLSAAVYNHTSAGLDTQELLDTYLEALEDYSEIILR